MTVHKRRVRDPAFAARWDEAKAYGSERNDLLLIDSVRWTLAGPTLATGIGTSTCPMLAA